MTHPFFADLKFRKLELKKVSFYWIDINEV